MGKRKSGMSSPMGLSILLEIGPNNSNYLLLNRKSLGKRKTGMSFTHGSCCVESYPLELSA